MPSSELLSPVSNLAKFHSRSFPLLCPSRRLCRLSPSTGTLAVGGAASNTPSAELVKAVRREWKSLRHGLPKGIYVRASEERMDLVRRLCMV